MMWQMKMNEQMVLLVCLCVRVPSNLGTFHWTLLLMLFFQHIFLIFYILFLVSVRLCFSFSLDFRQQEQQ